MSIKGIELNEDQQLLLLNEWNNRPDDPPYIKELIELAFPDIPEDMQDGRSKYGRAVKKFLSEKSLKAKVSHKYYPKERTELTEDQKEFISNNCGAMKPMEMAKTVFDDSGISPLDLRYKILLEFLNTINNKVKYSDVTEEGAIVEGGYAPPKSEARALVRVNKYVYNGIDKMKITPKIKRNLYTLIGYMHTFRFLHQISTYGIETDRELFESSFVRYTWDKPDLTQEEVDQYIVLSGEVVIASNIQRRVERLQQLLDHCAEETEGRRMAMSLVEAINTAQTEYNQCVNRQTKLLNELKVNRSQRMSKIIQESASILNLVELWKDEESRNKMIKIAELRKKNISTEIDRLSSMEEIKSRILGISEEEVLNG
jgi:hypothetical protein